MEVSLTPDQEAFIRQATGRLHRKENAVQEAMSLGEERERRRLEILVGPIRPKPRWRAAKVEELRRMRK